MTRADVPRVLLLGVCTEVWAPPGSTFPSRYDRPRYVDTRRRWLELAGVTDQAQAVELVPGRGRWSVRQPDAAEHLAEVGATRRDLAELRREADDLAASLGAA